MLAAHDTQHAGFLNELGVDCFDALARFPKHIQIETISGCNARCVMCSVDSWVRENPAMSQALFDRIVEELAPHSDWIERVIVQQDGEPLLDRTLEKKIAALKAVGIRHVSFATNGSLLNATRARSVIESGLDRIDFSIDGTTKEVFEGIRVNLSFSKVRDNVLQFLAIRDDLQAKLAVRVRMVIQRMNAHQFPDFVRFWQGVLSPQDLVFAKIEQCWSDWEKDLADVPGFEPTSNRPVLDFNRLPCISPFDSIVIFADGRVPLCCLDYNAACQMGDLAHATIADIWNGTAFKGVRQMHLEQGRRAMKSCVDCHNYVATARLEYPGLKNTCAAAALT
jgi:organic radical activating enzyme